MAGNTSDRAGDATATSPRITLAQMQGQTIAGGAFSLRAFCSLLGLAVSDEWEAGLGPRLKTAAWVKDRAELTIDEGPETPENVIVIERYHTGRAGLVHSKTLNVWARNDGVPWDLILRLRLAVRGKLGRLSAEHIARIFASDPEIGVARYEAPSVVAEAREDEFDRQAFLFNWGGADMWYQFFATAEYSRARLESLDLLDRATSVNHCDRECLANEPHIPLRVPLTNFPWDDRIRRTWGGREGLPAGPRDNPPSDLPPHLEPHREFLGLGDPSEKRGAEGTRLAGGYMVQSHYTELTDYDVIMGGQKKLARVLDYAIDNLFGDMIFAHVTCIPAVIGEDVDAVIRKAQEKSPVPILTLTMTPDAKDVIFGPILVESRKEAEDRLQVQNARGINLIGFPEDAATSELVSLLGELGVGINVMLMPRVQLERVRRLPLAALHVIHPNEFWQNLYNQLLFDTNIKSISPEAPYGYARTVAWVEKVVAAADGDHARIDAVLEAAWAPYREPFKALQDEARQHRLGFVLGADQTRQIADPGTTWGVALLGMLEEFGFSLDFMIHTGDRRKGREAVKDLKKALSDPDRHRFRLFQTPSQLTALLHSGAFSAVYSEHFFDFRLTRSGKAQFSLTMFERGFGGALRTLERLVEVCRLPLYRRYGKYMGPAFPWASDDEALASMESRRKQQSRDQKDGAPRP
jgi:hypothetical protein